MDFSFLGKYASVFWQGTQFTMLISIIALIFGSIIGMIACLMKISTSRILRGIASVYIELFRCTPILVQVYIFYFGLPQIGIDFPPMFGLSSAFVTGAFALSVNAGAYIAEILRAGIQSVDKGQMEASRSLGLSYSATMRVVIIPQAIKNVLPSLANQFIALVKESAIVSIIGVKEIMFSANTVRISTFIALEPLIVAAAIYFVLTFTLSKLVGVLERKLALSNG